MATKRSAPHVHPSRHAQVPEEPRRKKQKPNNAGPKSFKKAHTVNDLKSQIRSLRRLLERNEGMPATVRVEKERALQSAQHELAETEKAKKRNDMISRYHKIRFFDRQKATRYLKRARKQLQACKDDSGEESRMDLAQRVQDGEVDVNYAQYYPLDQPYVSLFPRKGVDGDGENEDDDADGQSERMERKGDLEMWQRVKQCMADGTLDELRNGKLVQQKDQKEEQAVASTARKKERKHSGVNGRGMKMNQGGRNESSDHDAVQSDSDDESGGDFFE